MSGNVHIRGQVEVVELPVKLNTGVPADTLSGADLIFLSKSANVSSADKAANFTWTTDLATTQAAFALLFAGIAVGRSRAGSTDARDLNLLVETRGVFRLPCASAQYAAGTWVGPAKNGSSNALVNTLVAVATKSLAIGRVVENAPAASTQIIVELVNTLTNE